VLWRCWLGGRKGIRPVKNWVVGCWRGCLGWGADLHIAQQMPLSPTVSCSSKSRLVITFLVLPFWCLLTRVVPDIFQKSSKTVVCVCACVLYNVLWGIQTWIYKSAPQTASRSAELFLHSSPMSPTHDIQRHTVYATCVPVGCIYTLHVSDVA